jgi:hypothetical protein
LCESVEAESAGALGETRELKKQQRMNRNRQSAALSRKRKADRIEGLTQRVSELEKVCKDLCLGRP